MQLSNYAKGLLHLFFPHNCLGCGNDVLDDECFLCASCIAQLPHTNLFAQKDHELERSFYGRVQLEDVAASFYFTKQSVIQRLVFALKYRGMKECGVFLGRQIADDIADSPYFKNLDLVIPLPLNKTKERKRGYNQAEVIANSIADVLQLPLCNHAVVRKAFTETQTKKDRLSRWQNMKDVFAVADANMLLNKHVLLVDDVVTTGATLEACAREILKVSGTKVSVACAAWTV